LFLADIAPGENIFFCPNCKGVNIVLVDSRLGVRGIYKPSESDALTNPVIDVSKIKLKNEDLVPKTLQPYLSTIKALINGDLKKLDKHTLIALQALIDCGVVVIE